MPNVLRQMSEFRGSAGVDAEIMGGRNWSNARKSWVKKEELLYDPRPPLDLNAKSRLGHFPSGHWSAGCHGNWSPRGMRSSPFYRRKTRMVIRPRLDYPPLSIRVVIAAAASLKWREMSPAQTTGLGVPWAVFVVCSQTMGVVCLARKGHEWSRRLPIDFVIRVRYPSAYWGVSYLYFTRSFGSL